MKILITAIVDLEKTAHNRLHQFVKYLYKDHDITVLSPNDHWKSNQTNTDLYNTDFKDVLENITIKKFTNKETSPIYQELTSFQSIGRLLKETDPSTFDIHFNYNTLISGYAVARKMEKFGIKTVYDIADDLPEMIRSSPQMPKGLRYIGWNVGKTMVNKNIARSEKITAIHAAVLDGYNVPAQKIEIVPNGVDTDLFKNYNVQAMKKDLGLEGMFVLGYVGVLREWVDFKPVFSAIGDLKNQFPNLRLLIVGEEGRFNENKILARNMGVQDNVIFTGTVQYAEVPKYISCMDVGLIPFDHSAISANSLPLKLFEYMACGKPVLSTTIPTIKHTLGDNVLFADSASEYISAIKELYAGRDEVRRLGISGRALVESRYSWKGVLQRFERVLFELSRCG